MKQSTSIAIHSRGSRTEPRIRAERQDLGFASRTGPRVRIQRKT